MKALVVSELRQRIRGRRWWILLAVWTFVLFVLVALVRFGVRQSMEFSPTPDIRVGAIMFGSLALFVLGLACLVLPSLTATSINGERDRGTLAVLQATLYRPLEILAAKFLAAMVTAAAFLGASLPIALWSATEGGVGIGRAAAVYLILFVVSGVLIALALGASALVRKGSLSAVLAYGAVFALTVGTLVLFGIAFATAPRQGPYGPPDPGARWLILAPNPFVVLADAAPRSGGGQIDDPLSAIRESVRFARDPEAAMLERGSVTVEPGGPGEVLEPPEPEEPAPVWPAGLAIELALAGAAAYAATARLKVPALRLAPGQRVA